MARWEGNDVRIELPRVSEAHIRTVAGEVAVTAASGTGSSATLDAEVVKGPTITVELDAGVLLVTHQPESWLDRIGIGGGRPCESIVTLTLPADVPVTVHTVSADVVIAGTQAGAGLTTVSGRITVTDVAGHLRVKSVSGSAEAQSIDGQVSVNTVSGRVVVAGRLSELNGHAVSGDLTFDLDDVPDASLSTVSGDVVLRLPSDATMHVDLTTMSGHLDSAFPFDGAGSKRRVSGDVGGGGDDGDGASARRIAVRTMSGDVALLRKVGADSGAER